MKPSETSRDLNGYLEPLLLLLIIIIMIIIIIIIIIRRRRIRIIMTI